MLIYIGISWGAGFIGYMRMWEWIGVYMGILFYFRCFGQGVSKVYRERDRRGYLLVGVRDFIGLGFL